MTPKKLSAIAKTGHRSFALVVERHTGIVLAHEIVVNRLHLRRGLVVKPSVSILDELSGGFAKHQTTNHDIVFEAVVFDA